MGKIKEEKINRENAGQIARAIFQSPQRAEEILKQNYKEKNFDEVHEIIRVVAPTRVNRMEAANDAFDRWEKLALILHESMRNNPLDKIPNPQQAVIKMSMITLARAILHWAKTAKNDKQQRHPVIEGDIVKDKN